MVLRSNKFFAITLISLLSALALYVTSTATTIAATSGGTLNFTSSSYSGTQNAGSVTVTVARTGGAGDAASIAYDTSENTALLGVDYVHTGGRLNWASGDSTSKTIKIPLINDTAYSGSKSFYITLSDAIGATAAAPTVATLTITGDGSPGVLALAASTYTAAENAGSVVLSVTRTSGSYGAASIAYDTSANTAQLGVNYVHTSGRLTWASGDSSAKTITVPLVNGTPYSGTKSFYLTLSDPDGALAGKPNVATLTINGDGSAGTVGLAASTLTVAQNAGSISVSVNRTGGSYGAASVGYGTANTTAVSGKDYTAESGVLKWATGDMTAKTFSVPISNGTPFTGSKSFAVALASASGATLGTPTSGVITINGDGTATTGTATLSWTAPTVNTNGTPLTNLAGYHIYYGTSPSSMQSVISVGSATTTSYELTNLAKGTWYFSINAYNTQGVESTTSVAESKTI